MRYSLNIDKTINQLIPHFMGGRKLILYLEAICEPLQSLNDNFVTWAKETKIEAAMTSQVIMIEYYLNRKFSSYFLSNTGRITIGETGTDGVPIYWEVNKEQTPFTVYEEKENNSNKTAPLYPVNRTDDANKVSFEVCSPAINTAKITKDEYSAMIASVVDKYKIAGKTYKILIN